MIAQLTEGVTAASRVLENRSESLLVVIIGVALVMFVFWRDSKKQEKDEIRMDRREESERAKDERDSDTLRLIGESTSRTADASKLMADTLEKMEARQERDRRAILIVIESMDARSNGDEVKANASLREARSILVNSD